MIGQVLLGHQQIYCNTSFSEPYIQMDEQEHQEKTYDGADKANSTEKLRAKQEKKNSKKAQKKAAKNSESSPPALEPNVSAELQEKFRMLFNQLAIREAIQPSPTPNNSQKVKDMSSHKFWSTQPVPKHG